MQNTPASGPVSTPEAQPELRPEARPVRLVVRHLRLDDVNDSNRAALLAAIDAAFGVDSTSFDDAGSTLSIAYDALQCNLDGLEAIIQDHGADIAHDWQTQFREGYYRFADGNIRDLEVQAVWGKADPESPH